MRIVKEIIKTLIFCVIALAVAGVLHYIAKTW